MQRQSFRKRIAAFSVLMALVGLCTAATTVATPIAAGAAGGISVSVGYADNLRANPSNFPTPWAGSPGVIYEGCSPATSCTFDAGAVKVFNDTVSGVTVNSVVIRFDTCTYDIWPHDVALPPGNQLIVTQTTSGADNGCSPGNGHMDSSDIGPGGSGWAGNCSKSSVIPEVDVTIDGVTTAFFDTGQVLNTGGVDAADCPHSGHSPGNESTQWTDFGPACFRAVLSLAPPNQTDFVGTTGTVRATLTNDCGTPLPGVLVDFSVIGGPNAGVNGSGVTDASGVATFGYGSSVTGADTVQASVTNLAGTFRSDPVTVTWDKRPSTVTYTGDTSADYHDSTVLSATLTDALTSDPLAGRTLSFSLGSQSCSATTAPMGNASCSIVLTQAPGPYSVTAIFAGGTTYEFSADTKGFTITPEQTTLDYTGDTLIAQGGPASLAGVLKEDGTTAIAGRVVSFTLGTGSSAQVCTGTTDAAGLASCAVNLVNQPLGPGMVTATFNGDAVYLPSSASASTLLFAFANGAGGAGSFVIGDGSSAVGAAADFWGAQWAKDNVVGGGAAPNSFKGYANATSAPPACGRSWATDPGNSSSPPSSVPSYMAVIVSSRITKGGATISGNTTQIVIVRTDAGYSPDPGHAGTGTVVAVLCRA